MQCKTFTDFIKENFCVLLQPSILKICTIHSYLEIFEEKFLLIAYTYILRTLISFNKNNFKDELRTYLLNCSPKDKFHGY